MHDRVETTTCVLSRSKDRIVGLQGGRVLSQGQPYLPRVTSELWLMPDKRHRQVQA